MSVRRSVDVETPAPVDHPSRSDGFVRGLSETIGGPIGEHAVTYDRPQARWMTRFWAPGRVVLALTCLTLVLHWLQKSPCQDGAWANLLQYKRFCYSDVLALYYSEGLDKGAVPYFGHAVEYPILTGLFMGALGLPIHQYALSHPGLNQGMWFYNLNAVVLCALAVATVGMILGLRRRRPWDAAMFALAPALLVTATINWDLLAIALAICGVYAWARRRPVLAGIMLGLGGSAKLWPLFLLGPLVVLALRVSKARQFADVAVACAGALGAWAVVNIPFMIFAYDGWHQFWGNSDTRGIDWGTLWYIGAHLPRGHGQYGLSAFTQLGANIPELNTWTYRLFALGCLAIAGLTVLAPRRPRFGQLAFLVIAIFLLTSKVWSQQFVLWLLPLAVLARPRWGAFLAWQFAEICYFLAFYGQMLNVSGKTVFPEGVFVLAATMRWVSVAVLCGLIVRDILRPDRDVVRRQYAEDPDGGVFNGAEDASWLPRPRGEHTGEPDADLDEPAAGGGRHDDGEPVPATT